MPHSNAAIRQTVLLLNQDLMTGIAVSNTTKALGLTIVRVPNESALVQHWQSAKASIALVVLDLNAPVEWEQLEPLLSEVDDSIPVIGFGPHVDIEGRRAAKQAGLTRIYSNGDFHRTMGEAIARYTGVSLPVDPVGGP